MRIRWEAKNQKGYVSNVKIHISIRAQIRIIISEYTDIQKLAYQLIRNSQNVQNLHPIQKFTYQTNSKFASAQNSNIGQTHINATIRIRTKIRITSLKFAVDP